MSKVFISYSRKDIEFAKRLTTELQKNELDFWIDWEGISPTVDWWKEIEQGIEEADIFLFMISPDSARSVVCGQEIDTAVKNGKRIIPLVVRDIKGDEAPNQLKHLNWIFFREQDDFHATLQKLLTAIHTDYEWAATHRRLQVKALEWDRNQREKSFLLHGKDLQDAEFQLATNSSKNPNPTDLQREYVFNSRRLGDRQRRGIISISIAGIIALAVLAVFGFYQAGVATNNLATAQTAQAVAQTNEAKAELQARISRVGELAAQSISLSDEDFLTSLLLAVEAYKGTNGEFESLQVQSALIQDAQKNPDLIQYLHEHLGSVKKVVFSPDGKLLASADAEGTIILWNVESRKLIGEPLNGHTGAVSSLSFSPNGTVLASSSLDGTILLWDMVTHQILGKLLSNDQEEVLSVAFSPDGQTLASGGRKGPSGSIVFWNVKSRQPAQQPIELNGFFGYGNVLGLAVTDLAFSPDGKVLASSNWGLVLWDVETRQPIAQLDDAPLASIAYSADGKVLAGGGAGSANVIMVWDAHSHERMDKTPIFHSSRVQSVALSPDGVILASGGQDNSIILWDLQNDRAIGEPLLGHTGTVTSIAFSSDGKTMASSSEDGTIILWDINAGQSIAKPLSNEAIYATDLAYSPDGTILASKSVSKIITLWDMQNQHYLGQLPSDGDPIDESNLAFSPDGKLLVSGNSNNAVIVWDVKTQKQVGKPMMGHTDMVTSVAFGTDGRTVASGSRDRTIILWDAITNKMLGHPLQGHTDSVKSVAFSPDGKILASSGDDNTIILWDIATHEPIGQPLEGHTGWVTHVAFSPNGKILASASDDRTVILWDVESHQPIALPLRGHTDGVKTLAFSPDGKVLASGSSNNVIDLWNMETLQLVSSMSDPLHTWYYPIMSMSFSPDGKTLATTRWLGDSIMLWDLDPGHLADKLCQRAGRNFTHAEWKRYFPDEEYRKTCKQWADGL